MTPPVIRNVFGVSRAPDSQRITLTPDAVWILMAAPIEAAVFGVGDPSSFQHSMWEKGCLSSSSALGLCLASTNMQRTKSLAASEQ